MKVTKKFYLIAITLLVMITMGFTSISFAEGSSAATSESTTYVVDDDRDVVIDEAEIHEVPYNIGVNRGTSARGEDMASKNAEIFAENFLGLFKVFFSFAVFVAILFTGIATIMKNQDGKARADYINRFKNIIIGVVLFSLVAVIANFAMKYQNDAFNNLYDGQLTDPGIIQGLEQELEGSWVSGLLEGCFNVVEGVLEFLLKVIFDLVTLNFSDLVDGTMSEYNINDAVFLTHLGDTIDLTVQRNDIRLTTAPFTVTEWDRYTVVYKLLSGIFIPLMLIALVKTSYELVICSGNFEKVEEAKKTLLRIFVSIALIVVGPYLFRLVLTIFNMLVFLIPASFIEFNFEMTEHAGLISAITKLWMMFIKFKILLTMLAREIMLTVMYLATPIIIGIWTISDKFKSVQLWMGETLSNAATQFCYALVIYLSTIVIHGGQGSPFLVLIWYSMMIKIADFFKDSLQGVINKWGGINESGIAEGIANQAKGWAMKATNTVAAQVDDDKFLNPTRMLANTMATVNFISSGDASGFLSEGKQLRKYGKAMIGKANEYFVVNNAIRRSGAYDRAIRTSAAAQQMDALFNRAEMGEKVDEQIDNLRRENASDSQMEAVYQARWNYSEGQKILSNAILLEQRGKHIAKKEEAFQGTVNKIIDAKEERAIAYAQVYGMKAPGRQYQLSKRAQDKINEFNLANDTPGFTDYASNMGMLPAVHIGRDGIVERQFRDTARNTGVYGNNFQSKNVIKYGSVSVSADPVVLHQKATEYANQIGENINDPAKAREAYTAKVAGEIAAKQQEVKRIIELQHRGKDNGISDDARRHNMQRSNEAVKSFVNYMHSLKQENLLKENDSVVDSLSKFIDEVEINGDMELANELHEKANAFKKQN